MLFQVLSSVHPWQLNLSGKSVNQLLYNWRSLECRPLTTGRTMNGRFPVEIPRDDSIFSVSSGRQSLDYQFISSSRDSLETDPSLRLSDASDIDYIVSFDSSRRSLEANSPHRFSAVSAVSHGLSTASNSSLTVMTWSIGFPAIRKLHEFKIHVPHVFCCNVYDMIRMIWSQKCRD